MSNPKKKNPRNELYEFLIGFALVVTGFYTFSQNVSVHTGFASFRIGNFQVGAGLIVVPFIVGIIMLFVMDNSFVPKLVTFAGVLIIITSVIMGTEFHFRTTSLYVYLLMLIGIFGGGALVLKVLFKTPDKEETKDEKKEEKKGEK